MGDGYTIREAGSADIPAAKALMITTVIEDFKTGYEEGTRPDIDDIEGVFLRDPRHTLFVAVDDATGDLIGTTGVRGGGLQSGPPDLVRRYDEVHTAQIARVYIDRAHRRRGIGRAMVQAALRFVLDDPEYTTIALHTFPHSPGALPFWQSIGTEVAQWQYDVWDERFFEISRERAIELAEGVSARS